MCARSVLFVIKRGSKINATTVKRKDFSPRFKVKMFPQMALFLLPLWHKLSCTGQSVQLPLRCGSGAILPLREQHNINAPLVAIHTQQILLQVGH